MAARSHPEASSTQFGRRPEDTIAPFLESLRLAQGDPIYRAISAQMDTLYQTFKEVYEQDQGEIRKLLFTLESQKAQIEQLASEYDAARAQLRSKERELAAATLAAAAAAQEVRDRQQQQQQQQPAAGGSSSPQQQHHAGASSEARQRAGPRLAAAGLNQPDEPQGADSPFTAEAGFSSRGPGAAALQRWGRGGGGGGGAGARASAMAAPLPAAAPSAGGGEGYGGGGGRERSLVSRRWRRQYLIVFLPYMLHPAHQCWRFYAAWQNSWTTRRTLWLAVAWVLVFLLAVGLLVGLLVPWDRLVKTGFTVGPQVVAVGSGHVSLLMALDREAAVYYAVVPEAFTSGGQAASGRRRLAGDLQTPSPANGRSADANAAAAAAAAAAADGGTLLGAAHVPGYWSWSWRRAATSWRALPQQRSRGALGHRRRWLAEGPGTLKLGDVDADDVRHIAQGSGDRGAALYPFAVACGQVDVSSDHTNYTLTVRTVGVPSVSSNGSNATAGGGGAGDECTASFGMQLNGAVLPWGGAAGPFHARRCLRCPVLLPGTPYVALLMGDGGRSTGVVQVRFTTAAAASPPPPPAPPPPPPHPTPSPPQPTPSPTLPPTPTPPLVATAA